MQKTCKRGNDVINAIRAGDVSAPFSKPNHQIAKKEARTTKSAEKPSVEQDGCNLDCKEDLQNHNNNVELHNNDVFKAHVYVFGLFNSVIKSWIEEALDFETKMWDKPMAPLREIEKKMHDPATAECSLATSTETLFWFLTTKQEDKEPVTNCAKWFKQATDDVSELVGKAMSNAFSENTKEHCGEDAAEKKQAVKKSMIDM